MQVKQKIMAICAGAAVAGAAGIATAQTEIHVQSRYAPLQFTDAAEGGAHPIGGPGHAFVLKTNEVLAPFGINLVIHTSGKVNSFDEKNVLPQLIDRKAMGNLYGAVAAGSQGGGIDAALAIPAESGLAFGEMLSGGVPFGMGPDEYASFLYYGGGLELQQQIYDEKFDGQVVVFPVAITSAQGPGFFPSQLPDPDNNPDLSNEEALSQLCQMPIIVRWPDSAASVLTQACADVGVKTAFIGKQTRCEDATALCDPTANPDNKVINQPESLTFGGFAPGAVPHQMFGNGNIDAFELNMPSEDIQFLKLISGQQGKTNAQADLTGVSLPFKYSGAWHQPALIVELAVNKTYWETIPLAERNLIEAMAKAAVLDTQAQRMSLQGDAIAQLEQSGVQHLAWPQGILTKLREAMPTALNAVAQNAASGGDTSVRRWLDATWAYQEKNARFFDYGDVNQGQAAFPTSLN